MLEARCPMHGRSLVGWRSLVALRNTSTGVELHVRCWCGEVGVQRTGRTARGHGGGRYEPAGS